MKVIKDEDKIEIAELKEMSKKMYDNLVKAVVDVEKNLIAIDAGLHSDLEEFLLEAEKSEPKNLWGINLWPDKSSYEFIEFDSMINLKPAFGNRTRGVENQQIRDKIIKIVNKFVEK
jgi:hypothetical protein